MGWIVVVVGVLAFAGMFIDPRAIWGVTDAWKYKHPEANEPSETAFELRRLGFAVGGVTLVCCGLALNGLMYGNPWGIDRSRDFVDEAVAGMGSTIFVPLRMDPKAAILEPERLRDHMLDAVNDRLGEVDKGQYARLKVERDNNTQGGNYYFQLLSATNRRFCWHITMGSEAAAPPNYVGVDYPITNQVSDGRC